MAEYFGSVSSSAKTLLEQQGGNVEPHNNGFNVTWPQGTSLGQSSDRGAWGNFSYRSWNLPTGSLCWDSDERQLQVASWK